MTLKEAVLQSLEDIKSITNHAAVYKHILHKGYYNFKDAKTPASTISACLGDFVRNGDSRVKRRPEASGNFSYYLTKHEQEINVDDLLTPIEIPNKIATFSNNYHERSLHKLLSTFLHSNNIHSKTIFHEQSFNSKDSHQKWVHPDLVGISFLHLLTKTSHNFFKSINRADTFKIFSYEIKRKIHSDYDLKESFFQAVSNSSWANYGYLVALEINSSLSDEMERLNQSFGIGIIELKANPFESKILFPSRHRDLDIKTIDKLCNINKDFDKFIEQTEKLLTASERYINSTQREFAEFCDDYFSNESEIEAYCKEKNIPTQQ
jgi:hypothetical protein